MLSFEKSKALKEAGLPQPKHSKGQTWFNGRGELLFVLYVAHRGYSYFRPTATDIFPFIASKYEISFDLETKDWLLGVREPVHHIWVTKFNGPDLDEVCADAFLYEQKEKDNG